MAGSRRILIVDGHPDPGGERFTRALVAAYRKAAIMPDAVACRCV
jgi:hypothetical protein